MTECANPGLTSRITSVRWMFIVGVLSIPISASAGLLSTVFGKQVPEIVPEVVTYALPSDIPLLSAQTSPNPVAFHGGAEVVVQDGALVSSGPIGGDVIAAARLGTGEISVYTVREGDTLSHIARMYGVTANTILWANDLPRASAIQPGQTLVILPVAGVQHVVKKGDTIANLAKRYKAEEADILSYNQLDTSSSLTLGETLIIPGGTITVSPTTKPASGAGTGGRWLAHPAPGTVKTQGIHGYNAVDFAAAVGTAIRAAASGEVIVAKSSGWNGGYGQYVVIKHKNGVQTLYAHLSRVDVSLGTTVAQGEVIGAMGNTGRSTGPHLHFEVRGGSNPF